MNITRSIQTWRRSRETARELNRLSQRNLEDVGIFRSDISAIAKRLAR